MPGQHGALGPVLSRPEISLHREVIQTALWASQVPTLGCVPLCLVGRPWGWLKLAQLPRGCSETRKREEGLPGPGSLLPKPQQAQPSPAGQAAASPPDRLEKLRPHTPSDLAELRVILETTTFCPAGNVFSSLQGSTRVGVAGYSI